MELKEVLELLSASLAIVSILLGIFGVVIGILAFFGYKAILSKAVSEAVIAATNKIDEALPEFQKNILEELRQSGAINNLYDAEQDNDINEANDAEITKNLIAGDEHESKK